MVMPALQSVLIVVHPGSCCGSATFNLGRWDANASRDGLVIELDSWVGPIAVIDGDLSHELSGYPSLAVSLQEAIGRCSREGFPHLRIDGGEANAEQLNAAAALIADRLFLSPEKHRIWLTGAWTHADDEDGCIDTIYNACADRGFMVDVRESAFVL